MAALVSRTAFDSYLEGLQAGRERQLFWSRAKVETMRTILTDPSARIISSRESSAMRADVAKHTFRLGGPHGLVQRRVQLLGPENASTEEVWAVVVAKEELFDLLSTTKRHLQEASGTGYVSAETLFRTV